MLKNRIRYLVAAGGALGIVVAAIVFLRFKNAGQNAEVHFRDAAVESGLNWQMRYLPNEQGETYKLNLYDHGSGLAIADYDGDGHDDIYFVNQLGPNALYRNKGDGTFEDATAKAGVALGDRICTAATFADYTNEGRQSLFVTSTRGGNVLFHNKGDGTFQDVTDKAGLKHVGHSQSGFFLDYDNDGFLDLLVLQTGVWTTDQLDEGSRYFTGKGQNGLFEIAGSNKEYNILYHNVPDGHGGRKFVKVNGSGLEGKGWAADAAIVDYDGDGALDVLITSMFGPAQLYRNLGAGKFKEVDTKQVLGRTAAGGMGTRAFGSTNDGKLDLYIVDMHSDMWVPTDYNLTKINEKKKHRYMFVPEFWEKEGGAMEFEKKITDMIQLPYDEVLFGNTFHRNQGGGKFLEMSDKANLETFWPWGIATGDFDNDGYEDVFVPSGMGYPWNYWPNRLLMNKGDGTFVERSHQEGVEPPAGGVFLENKWIRGVRMARSSRAAAVADFEGNGQLNIVTNNFNDRPYYFKNSFPRKNYVAFRLQGGAGLSPRKGQSNRDAIGAVVRLYVDGQIMTRQVNTAAGYLSQSSKTIHYGLGDHTQIDKAEIQWPGGKVQTLERPAANTLHKVVEPD